MISVGPLVSNSRSIVNGVWLLPELTVIARDWMLTSFRWMPNPNQVMNCPSSEILCEYFVPICYVGSERQAVWRRRIVFDELQIHERWRDLVTELSLAIELEFHHRIGTPRTCRLLNNSWSF